MKTIHYADYDVTTTDATSDAVLAYAQALALKGRSDTVHVSGFDEAGNPKDFDLLIGPSSQIIASSSDLDLDVTTDGSDVAELTARTDALLRENHVTPGGTFEDYRDLDDGHLSLS
jgi:hypothetical protein